MENFKRLTLLLLRKKRITNSMKNLFTLLLFSLFAVQSLHAQAGGNYTMHTVKKGESLSALARQYGTTVGDIMRLNGMNDKSILKIGEKIKIPPKNSAAIKKTTTSGTVLPEKTTTTQAVKTVPKTDAAANTKDIKHTVVKGETLSKIGGQYHITVAELKTWNNLKSDVIKIGQVLIVKPGSSTAIAANKLTVQPATAQKQDQADTLTTLAKQNTEKVTVPPADSANTGGDHIGEVTVKKKGIQPKTANKTVKQDAVLPEKTTVKKNTGSSKTKAPSRSDTALKEQVIIVPKNTNVTNVSLVNVAPEGFFAPIFGKEVEGRSLQTITGTGMIFKTASGWADKKYYILMNDAPPGSVVKVNSFNGKTIYAKVLWNIKDMSENEGLNFRISNAAAEALGLTDSKFQLMVTYYE